MSPARIALMLHNGTWLPGDGPAMRCCFTHPCGLWLRVCADRQIARNLGGLGRLWEQSK